MSVVELSTKPSEMVNNRQQAKCTFYIKNRYYYVDTFEGDKWLNIRNKVISFKIYL